jgi:predicted glycosyltransferase involved in capsule biosynthesis
MLSVILPIRAEASTSYLVDRLGPCLERFAPFEGVECVVVNSASAPPLAARIRSLCARPRVTFVEDPAPLSPFAPGVARNLGAQAARGDHLLFYDVDLVNNADFIPALEKWCAVPRDPCAFLMVPCLYVSKVGTEKLGRGPIDLAPYLASYFAGENHLVENIAISTSTVVVTRSHFLRLGGNRSVYQGHGCEDFDLLHRLASYWPEGARPDDYYVDERTRFPINYKGFRAYLARYSLPHLFGGPYTAHLWHARPIVRRYWRQRERNEAVLQDMMRGHDAGKAVNPPLRSTVDGDPVPSPLPATWATTIPAPPIREVILDLLARHGRDPEVDVGLLRWKAGVTAPRSSRRSKLRKLILRPKQFFEDTKFSPLRRIAKWLPRDTLRRWGL